MPLQTLFDDLAGAAGAPVNRPALNAFVANSQAMNGLRSAETEDALQRAQQAAEQETARQRLGDMFTSARDAAGNPLYTPSQSNLLADEAMAGLGNAAQLGQAATESEQSGANLILGNPADLNTAAATAAQQVRTGKIAGPTLVPSEYETPAGVAPPQVNETPQGQARINASNANADLHEAEAKNPAAFGHMPVLTPEQQSHLTDLEQLGVVSPERVYSYARNPTLIDSAWEAQQGNPTGIAGLAAGKEALRKSYMAGQDHAVIVRGDTALGHLAMLPQAVQALQTGNYPLLNRLVQGVNIQTGAAAPMAFDTLKHFLGSELSFFVQGGRSAHQDRAAIQDVLGRWQSPQQFQGVMQELLPIVASRMNGEEQNYAANMAIGKPQSEWQYRNEFRGMLTPQARQLLGMGFIGAQPAGAGPAGGGAAPPAGPGAAPPAAAPPLDIAALARAELAKRQSAAGGANGNP